MAAPTCYGDVLAQHDERVMVFQWRWADPKGRVEARYRCPVCQRVRSVHEAAA